MGELSDLHLVLTQQPLPSEPGEVDLPAPRHCPGLSLRGLHVTPKLLLPQKNVRSASYFGGIPKD